MTTVDSRGAAPARAQQGPQRVLLRAASTCAELAAALDEAARDAPNVAFGTSNVPNSALIKHPGGPRIGIVDPTPQRLAMARKVVEKGNPLRGRRDIWFSPEPLLAAGGKLAFIYPGLEADFAPRVDDVANMLGVGVPELSTQSIGRHAAAVFAVDRLMDDALRLLGIRPDAVAGHSAGEWAAVVAGGIVARADFDDMIARADLDALQVPGVEFAVLGCSAERASREIAGLDGLAISLENSPQQTVVCGPGEAVRVLVERLRKGGVICQLLPFRSGFHTPHLEPYLGPFRRDGLPGLPMRTAETPVWSGTTASPYPAEPDAIRALTLRQLLEPVRFTALIRGLYDDGVRVFVQSGPGQLGSLIDDCLRAEDHLTVAANSMHRPGLEQLRRVATAIWVEGGNPDFGPLEPAQVRHDARPFAVPEHAPHDDSSLGRLRELSARYPAFAELDALLNDTAASVAAVVEAAEAPSRTRTLDVSTATMPYLLDHCMAAQRPGWPDETDRRPVMPATTMVAHMMQAALAVAPGRVVTDVEDIRFHKWLTAAPATQVEVGTEQLSGNRVRVQLGEFCSAEVVLAASYPPYAPEAWKAPRDERAPVITAERMYTDRWMFHGPAFQGLTGIGGISSTMVRGQITVTEPPGALLDNWGQLIGHWLTETQPYKCIAFPARIERITFHGAEPPAGLTVDAAVRIKQLSPDSVTADGQIVVGGRTAISVHGWHDFRVDGDQRVTAVHRFPDRNTLAERRPDGWWLLADPWQSLASREFYLHKYLNAVERVENRSLPPLQRRRWLLGRLAVKDAARGWLARAGFGNRYPAELKVSDVDGGFLVRGLHGLRVPELTVAAAQAHELSVARVRQPGDDKPDVAELAEVIEASLHVHKDLSRHDEELLDRARRSTRDPLPTALARLATVRAVAAKAGCTLPPVVSDVDGTTFVVEGGTGQTYRIWTELVRNPDSLPKRQYIFAWLLSREETVR